MHVKFDSLNRYETPKLVLCNPGSSHKNGVLSKVVGILSDTSDEELVINFNAISELNFRCTKVRRENDEDNEHTYSMFKSLENRRLIFVEGIGYFSISDVQTNSDQSGAFYKDIKAQSCDVEIQNKMIPYIEDGTYQFTPLLEKIVSVLPLWVIGHIDPSVSEKHRTFEDVSDNQNCLSFMLDNMQNAYECIFIFDTIDRIINVYDQNSYIRHTDIHITKHDLINSINISESSENLYTAISVIGDDNVTIAAINPIGTNTIYNFDHYIGWMSEGLGTKVTEWQAAISGAMQEYYDTNLEYCITLEERSNLQSEIDRIEVQATMYKRCRDNIVADSGVDLVPSYNEAIVSSGGEPIEIFEEIQEVLENIDLKILSCEANRSVIMGLLEDANAKLSELGGAIESIHDTLSFSAYFSEEEIEELSNYIYEGSYSDEYVTITDIMSYTDKFNQMKTLYDRAKSQLDRASRPTQEFTIDVENFVFQRDFMYFSEQIETGCLINAELDDDDVAALFLSNITINYEDEDLSLTFGNRFNKFDPKTLFDNVLGNINKSANTLTYIKEILYPIKNGELNQMQEAIQSSRDLTMNSALSADGERVIIDASGYTGKTMLENGTYDPRQVKITGRSIVFTDDAWRTCKVALGELALGNGESAYGVNANTIIGDIIMGSNLHIVDSNGNDLLTVVDGKISMKVSDVEKSITEVEQLASGLAVKVSAIENTDVDHVTTTTGYTFNSDGLSIHKSGEEIRNLLDNTGMYVTRSDESILTANNEGVTAINLHARQYLIAGEYCRFEDYSTDTDPKRTACYFTGN